MKILIAGDYCDRYRVSEAIKNGQYGTMFDNVKSIIERADYSIVNFEFPIIFDVAKPIAKIGPVLGGQKSSVEAIKYAGFKCCTLANNHILDQGAICGLMTKNYITEVGLDVVGLGDNEETASSTLYKRLNGSTIAIINCCEHEFSVATKSSSGAYGINPVRQFYSIQEAKKHADYVLVIVHGGHELYNLPSIRMKETYRFFIDVGADVVVNHHQHVFSGYEVYKGKPIFYGLGNFLFDCPGKQCDWNEGYIVILETEDSSFSIVPFKQCIETPSVQLLNKEEEASFNNKISNLNCKILDDNYLRDNLSAFAKKYSKDMKAKLSPYNNTYIQELSIRGYLPSFVSKKRILDVLNYIECEAHRDIFVESLKYNLK